MWIFQGSTEEEVEFPGLIKKYHGEFPYSKSSFLPLNFPRGVTQFHKICKGKAFFCPEFPQTPCLELL